MRILIIIMLLCTTLVPNYLYAISHENYSEESFLFVGEDYMQENYKVTLHLSGVSVSTLFNEIQKQNYWRLKHRFPLRQKRNQFLMF